MTIDNPEDYTEGTPKNYQRSVTIDDAFEDMGGFGRFQFLCFIIIQFAFYSGGYLLYNLIYLELIPKY